MNSTTKKSIWQAFDFRAFLVLHIRSRMWVLTFLCQLLIATALLSALWIDRHLSGGVATKTAEFIASDLRIEHNQLDFVVLKSSAQKNNLRSSGIYQALTSVVTEEESLELVQLKAIEKTYPLRGNLILRYPEAPKNYGKISPGSVWVDEVLNSKGFTPGKTIRIGDLWFEIEAVIEREPDRPFSGAGLANRVMISTDDFLASGLTGPGSRFSQFFLLAGEQADLENFRKQTPIPERAQVSDKENSRRDIRETVKNLNLFINLSGLIALLFTCIVLYLSLQLLSTQEHGLQGLLRQWGYGRARRFFWFFGRILSMTLLANLIAGGLAWCIQLAFAKYYLSQIFVDLPPLDPKYFLFPWLLSGLILPMASISLWGTVLRPEIKSDYRLSYWQLISFALMMVLFALYFYYQIDNLYLLYGLLISLTSAVLMQQIFVRLVLPWFSSKSPFWSLLASKFSIHPRMSLLYVGSLALVAMIVISVYLLRQGALLNSDDLLADGAPNHYLISISEDMVEPLRSDIAESFDLTDLYFYPLIRARVTNLNGQKIDVEHEDPIIRRRLSREWSLSYSRQPSGEVIAGQWFAPDEQDEQAPKWSVSTEVLDALDASLGDSLTFKVAGFGDFTGQIGSIRKVNWASFKPNFFVLSKPDVFADVPRDYFVALALDAQQQTRLNAILAQYPGVTHLDLNVAIFRIQEILKILLQLMLIVLVYTIILSTAVVYCILKFNHETSSRLEALQNSFGVPMTLIRRARWVENLIMSVLAVSPASVMAIAASYFYYAQWTSSNLLDNLLVSAAGCIIATSLVIAILTTAMDRFNRSPDVYKQLRGQAEHHA